MANTKRHAKELKDIIRNLNIKMIINGKVYEINGKDKDRKNKKKEIKV